MYNEVIHILPFYKSFVSQFASWLYIVDICTPEVEGVEAVPKEKIQM